MDRPDGQAGVPPQAGEAPIVSAAASSPEITVKAILLSVILAAGLAAANAYLGLFAGMTVSASIPAAVAALAILRLFRRANILENNIVQTAASSGEALAAGVIFTIPALTLIGAWPAFDYWRTTAIAVVGGLLGVLFTIPLRRALILGARLQFPEGVATAAVLKAGWSRPADPGQAGAARAGLRTLLGGALAGGATKLGETGLRLWAEAWEGTAAWGSAIFYAGVNLSPALLAVGFIIGLKTALVVVLGGMIGWGVLLPAAAVLTERPPGATGLDTARALWSGQIRFVGIGAMLVGGLWTLLQLRGPIRASLQRLLEAARADAREPGSGALPRTERDASLPWIVGPFLLSLIPMGLIYHDAVGELAVAVGMTLVMAVAAFLFSSVAAYMAGLVGSSSNPVSGVTIATLMLASLLLVLVMGRGHPGGPAAALLIGAVVCCAAAMGGDNLQDLKTGHLVGATPWKQQVMQVVGVVAGALVIAPVLALLQAKYGIGEVTPAHPHPLSAPQATLMASLAQGVFGRSVPWDLVGLGALIGTAVILADRRLEATGAAFRLPVLGVALGIYLPLKLSAAIVLGGCIAALARRRASAGGGEANGGLLVAAGLVTGEALMGILLAVPLALAGTWPALGADPFALFEEPPLGAWPGVVALAGVAGLLYRTARRS